MKIGILVPDEEMGRLAASVGAEMGVEIYWNIFDNEVVSARKLIRDHDVQAIIARNPAGYALEERLDIPVVLMHISRMDILRAVQQVTPGKVSAFVYVPDDRNKYDFDQSELEDISDHPIRLCAAAGQVEGACEIEDVDLRFMQDDADAFFRCDALISGTPRLIRFGRRRSMETHVIHFDMFDMRNAIDTALRMIRARERERQNTRLLELALNSTKDGFLILENRRVIMANENVCNISGMAREDILRKKAPRLAEESPFFQLVFGVPRREIIHFEGRPYSVFLRTLESSTPSSPTLELISIIDVPNIQKTEASIRKAMDSSGFVAKWRFQDILMQSRQMASTVEAAKQYANSDLSVLILGESGTGKEVFAQSVHNASPFASGPFVALNCAALPENLIESELFGYEEGAFTGAKKGGRAGLFELSHGGTLFLDEIGELPTALQAKLLRSLQEKCIYRVGGDRMIPIRNRLICATNRDLYQLVAENRFREDLLYRINVLQIQIPPLRERKEDIPLFVRRFFAKNLRHGVEEEILEDMSRSFMQYDWPGNVRELENYMARLLVMRRGGTSLEHIGQYMAATLVPSGRAGGHTPSEEADKSASSEQNDLCIPVGTMKEMELALLKEMYRRCGCNLQTTAKTLDLGYSTVWRKLKPGGSPEKE